MPRCTAVVLCFLLLPLTLAAQSEPVRIPFPDPRLTVDGLGWWKETQPSLQRLPERLKPTIPPKVWRLAQIPAGVRVRLRTDSVHLTLEAKTGTYKVAPSPALGLIGIDLYVNGRYHGSTLPEKEDGLIKKTWDTGKRVEMRDITLYLPIGTPTLIQSITLDPGAKVELAPPYSHPKPIVYYGSSITQGAQTSNPGMAFPCVLGRWLDMDFINLGFSGNGKGEPALAHAVAEIDAACFVLDYWANPTPTEYSTTLPGFVDIIRAKHPTTPILVPSPYYNPSEAFGSRMGEYQVAKRKFAPKFVEQRRAAGDANIHFVDGFSLISPDQADALSDARHANTYGMFLYARGLEPHLRRVLTLPPSPAR
ncbi:SGNH-like hydrolase/esterase family protein [Roseimicrobium gellanilyticum]|uniref:SGNH-like hydrolase/esterase family protein n=1 Tax=Roseimicrobium gellanilyticum TaxID=748857 RepID=A0A366H4V4_9BACT|nr:SGNH/GDSL hydrolase family protein [Roseimicrobium gellanilyticum]RBP35877.1 SGNH-like hydrolase/esterase family protein [Roseimicrobium gellanilyticum]